VSVLNEEARSIVEVIRTIAGAFDGRDLDTLLATHFQGPECSMIAQGGERVVGWDGVRAQLENRMNEFEYSRTKIDNPVVTLFGDIAVVTYEQRTDSRLHDIDFKWIGWVTDVMVRREGRWLRVHHQQSDRSK
jgi:ketosteroid isomerase-like protein